MRSSAVALLLIGIAVGCGDDGDGTSGGATTDTVTSAAEGTSDDSSAGSQDTGSDAADTQSSGNSGASSGSAAEPDCLGTLGGDAAEDECGVCDDNPYNDCIEDCAGQWGGQAAVDDCGVCAGGDTGLVPNADLDSCGLCGGDDSGCLSFELDVLPVLLTHCSGCHGAAAGLRLKDYESIMAGDSLYGPVVIPGDDLNSLLVRKMRGTAGYGAEMPPGSPLEPSEVDIVALWIVEGARNN